MRTIQLKQGFQNSIVSEIEEELVRLGLDIYDFNEALIRLVHSDKGVLIKAVDAVWLWDTVSENMKFEKFSKDKDQWYAADVPKKYIEFILSRNGDWRFRPLKAISHVPLITKSGRIIMCSGYDKETKFYFDSSLDWSHLKNKIEGSDVDASIKALKSMIETIPFQNEFDKSVYLSALLSLFVPIFIQNIPIFGFSATTAGTGKSMLVDMMAIIISGRNIECFSWGDRDDESEKRLAAKLMTGDRIIFIDNVETSIKSELLCSYATQEFVSVRILGKSEFKTVSTSPVVVATGNNLRIEGDLIRRSLLSILDAKCERPELRKFDIDLKQYCAENRASLVSASLILLKSFIDMGAPGNLSAFGSFEEWSRIVRGCLIHYGFSDPYESVLSIRENDPELETLKNVMNIWKGLFGFKALKVITALEHIPANAEGESKGELMSIVSSIANGKDSLIMFGRYLHKNRGRIINGLSFEKESKTGGSSNWKLKDHTV